MEREGDRFRDPSGIFDIRLRTVGDLLAEHADREEHEPAVRVLLAEITLNLAQGRVTGAEHRPMRTPKAETAG